MTSPRKPAHKQRWTSAQKAEARKVPRKPHRGQGVAPGAARPVRDGAAARDAAPRAGTAGGRFRREEPRPQQERWTDGFRGPGTPRRDERGAYARPPFQRDDRPRGDRPEGRREDRAPYRRDDRPGYQREDRRDDRGGYQRDDRGGYQRRDRAPYQREDRRPDRPSVQRDERAPYRRDDRPGFQRDDRRDDRGGYQREDRPGYQRGDRRDDRGGYQRPERAPFRRDDRRDDRPGYQRAERTPFRGDDRRDDRRDDRPGYQRAERAPSRGDERRDERGGAQHADRAGFQRADERQSADYPRADRRDEGGYQRPDRAPYQRDDRPGYQREERSPYRREDRPAFRREGRPERRYDDRPAHRPAPNADRLRRQERPVREPAPRPDEQVGADNAFVALGVSPVLASRMARDSILEPFPIQAATIPDALAGKDVLGRGQTGSGKTLAFGLPTLQRLAEGPKARPKHPRALVLVPTRELAMQVSDALEPLAHVLGLRHKLVAGGLSYTTQFAALDRGVELLIATPGRLNDLIEREAVNLDDVQIAILDEADHMADMGFLPEVSIILDLIPAGGQRLLFSATLDHGIDEVVERYLQDPVVHSTDDAQASVTTMDHHLLLIDPQHKKLITADVANRDGRTLVFVRTKLGADRVALQLREQGVLAAALHGGLNQNARNRVLAAFKDGRLPVLVATDVAARGIHVDDVSVVMQVDPPADHKDYLHRAGRTARAGEKGTVVTLALPHQRKMMQRICDQAGVEITPVRVAPGDDALLAATGARRTSGVPIPEEIHRRIVEGEPRRYGRPGGRGGPRHGGGRYGGPRG